MDLRVKLLEEVPRLANLAGRTLRFVLRHRWSLPLAIVSSVSLLNLADEIRDDEMAAADAAIASFIGAWRGQLDGVMLALTWLGDWISMTVLTALVVLILLTLGRRREAVFMATGAGGTLVLSTILKLIFQRDRPEDLGYLIPPPSSFSFPSGHAMGSMGVLATSLVILHALGTPRPVRLGATVLAALIVLGVALSRVYFGVHFPSDVLGGQLGAAAWVSAMTGWFYPQLLPGEQTGQAASPPDQ